MSIRDGAEADTVRVGAGRTAEESWSNSDSEGWIVAGKEDLVDPNMVARRKSWRGRAGRDKKSALRRAYESCV